LPLGVDRAEQGLKARTSDGRHGNDHGLSVHPKRAVDEAATAQAASLPNTWSAQL
jgi:hypothetical protein